MMLYIPIAGTRVPWRGRNANPHDWYRRSSPFDHLVADHGFMRVEQDRDPDQPDRGFWSGTVNGLLLQTFWRRSRRHRAWCDGAQQLQMFLMRRHAEFAAADGLTLIAHSHGGQVLAYALARDPDYPPVTVVTVDMPVRRDMEAVYEQARKRPCVRRWVHLYSGRGWSSRFRWLGSRLGPRTLAVADENVAIEGGHSGILSDAAHMQQWPAILARLQGETT